MATILAYTSPGLGHCYPISALLMELRNRGHRVAVRTLTAGVGTALELGFDAAAIDPRIEAITMDDWIASNPWAGLRFAFDAFEQRSRFEIDDLRSAIDGVRPDALIVDCNCWGAAAVADVGAIPWLAFWPFPPYLRSRGAPPYGPGLRPLKGHLGRIRDAALRPVVTGTVEKLMLPRLNRIRSQAGAMTVSSADEFIRRAELLLVASAEPFEYSHPDWDDSVQMVGPCLFDPVTDPPDWLDAIEDPIVLVSTSSERQDDSGLALAAIEALADEPVHVVATLPTGLPAGMTLPTNATVCEFVPHGPVLDRAVCAVTHGGMGVTQKALSRGVPVCVVPYGRDQLEVARRVEVSGCGTRLPARRLSAERLRDKIKQAMTMTVGARRVADGFVATGGVARGADLVEQRLLSRTARPGPEATPRSS
jgi:MGT family glycosyltransferase